MLVASAMWGGRSSPQSLHSWLPGGSHGHGLIQHPEQLNPLNPRGPSKMPAPRPTGTGWNLTSRRTPPRTPVGSGKVASHRALDHRWPSKRPRGRSTTPNRAQLQRIPNPEGSPPVRRRPQIRPASQIHTKGLPQRRGGRRPHRSRGLKARARLSPAAGFDGRPAPRWSPPAVPERKMRTFFLYSPRFVLYVSRPRKVVRPARISFQRNHTSQRADCLRCSLRGS